MALYDDTDQTPDPNLPAPLQDVPADPAQQLGGAATQPPPMQGPQLGAPPPVVVPQVVTPAVVPPPSAMPPTGGLRATPQQATAANLASSGQQQNLAQLYTPGGKDANGNVIPEGGSIVSERESAIAKAQADAATEQAARNKDRVDTLKAATDRHDENRSRTLAVIKEAHDKSNALAAPEDEFWSTHGGTVPHVLATIASFISGMGNHHAFKNYLDNAINQNYENHRSNINDLYKEAVEDGKIDASDDTHNKFVLDAKNALDTAATAKLTHDLASIGATSNSKVAQVMAQQGIAHLQQQDVARRQALTQNEATQAAAQLAQQRAWNKEDREQFRSLSDDEMKNGAPDRATADRAALEHMQRSGLNRSRLAPLMEAAGATYDPKSGKYDLPETKSTSTLSSAPTIGENGEIIPPTVDSNGKRMKPEEGQKFVARSVIVDGKVQVYPTEKEAQDARDITNAVEGHIANVDNAIKNVKAITAGGVIGNLAAKLPAGAIPEGTEARSNVAKREAYNTNVVAVVASLYKAGGNVNEPKGGEAAQKLAEPFKINPGDNEQVALAKMNNLKQFILEQRAARLGTGISGQPNKSATQLPQQEEKGPKAPGLANKLGLKAGS